MDRIDRSKDFDVVKYGRGTVWYIDFGIDDKKRPAIIMSVNRNYPEIAVIPLTTQQQQDLPWNVKLSMPDRESIAKCNCLQRVNIKSICSFVGVVSDEVMHALEVGVCAWLGIKCFDNDVDDKNTTYNRKSSGVSTVSNDDITSNKRKPKYIRWTEDLINEFLSDYDKSSENEEEFLLKWSISSLDAAKKTSYRLKKRLKDLKSR